jgi:ferrochelatase
MKPCEKRRLVGVTAEEPTGLLLVNLGSPESPRVPDVRAYLREFLSDPRVIDIHPLKRWLLLHLIILRFRPRRAAEAYGKIWTDRGSPLVYHGRDLVAKVQQRLGAAVRVDLGMRYGRPSIASSLERMRDAGIGRVVVFPLYPQYSAATTGSSEAKARACAAALEGGPRLQFVPPFYDHPAFVEAGASVAREYVERPDVDRVFFSFHGLPERQLRKSDPTGDHCLRRADCCERIVDANRSCYRAQCLATARRLAEALAVPEDKRVICFQSRLGREPWIRPYTEEMIEVEARRGARRAVILSPSFVADCLETLEELGIRAVASWQAAGGVSMEAVPCLNARDEWVEALITIARDGASWLRAS